MIDERHVAQIPESVAHIEIVKWHHSPFGHQDAHLNKWVKQLVAHPLQDSNQPQFLFHVCDILTNLYVQ